MIRNIKNKINNNKESKVVLTNFIALLVLKGGNYIFPLLYLPYLVKVLGITQFGLVSFAESIMLYFKAITDYGFDLTGTRDIAKNKHNVDYISRKVSNVLMIKLILLIICGLVLIVLIHCIDSLKTEKVLYYFSFLPVIGYALLPSWFFQGMEKMKYITLLFFIARALSTTSLFFFVKDTNDYILVPLLNGFGYILSGALGVFLMFKYFNLSFKKVSVIGIKEELQSGFDIFISTLAPNLYNNSMTFLLGIFASKQFVGYYSAAVKLIDVANSLISMLSKAIFPYFNRNLSSHSKLQILFLLPSGLISIFLFIMAEMLVKFLYGDIAESSIVLRIIATSPFFLAIMSCYGTNYLLVIGKDGIVKNITLICSLFGLFFAFILIPTYLHVGAAITLVSVRSILAVSNWSYYLRFKHLTTYNSNK